MLAAYHGHPALVKLLLDHGADPNKMNDRGQSPLAGAVFKMEDEVIEVCMDHLIIAVIQWGSLSRSIDRHVASFSILPWLRRPSSCKARIRYLRSSVLSS